MTAGFNSIDSGQGNLLQNKSKNPYGERQNLPHYSMTK